MINYHNIVFPFLHRHGCRQEADSNFRDFARTSQIKSSIRQSRSLRINNKSGKTNSFQVNLKTSPPEKYFPLFSSADSYKAGTVGTAGTAPFFLTHTCARYNKVENEFPNDTNEEEQLTEGSEPYFPPACLSTGRHMAGNC